MVVLDDGQTPHMDHQGGTGQSEEEEPGNDRIQLAVYNIIQKFRVYHVGVLVRGKEFHYGMRIGVFTCNPRNGRRTFHVSYVHNLVRWRIQFMRHIDLHCAGGSPKGQTTPLCTTMTMEQLVRVCDELSATFAQSNYHLLNNNCLDFARVFIQRIAVNGPMRRWHWPQEIRQPRIIMPIRFVCRGWERGDSDKHRAEGKARERAEEQPPQRGSAHLHITTIKILPVYAKDQPTMKI